MGCLMDRETGTQVEKGVDVKSLKDPAPNLGQTEEKKTAEPSNSIPRALFELGVQWCYSQNGEQVHILIDQLQFCNNPFVFFQKGLDSLGSFTVEGKLQADGSTRIEMKHTAQQQSKVFTGKFEDNILAGTWEDASHQKGTFTLELVACVWKTEGTNITLKSPTELVGVGYFSYGWAMIIGNKSTSPKAKLNLYFADGKAGSFDCDLSADVISGSLQLPTGTTEISLSNKNEFA